MTNLVEPKYLTVVSFDHKERRLELSEIKSWKIEGLSYLLARGCDWLSDYLASHPDDPQAKEVREICKNKFLLEAYEYLGEKLPKGTASTDDEGGIRLNWKNHTKDSRICLFCPANPEETAYIYHQKNDEYASDEQVSETALVYWLDWFEGT